MTKETKDKHFIQKPVYLGGKEAMSLFIKENLKYPEKAKENRIEGSVYARYAIDHKGNVVDVDIISSLGHGCDEEAERIIRMLKFNVAKQFKARVLFHKNIRIWFKLKQEKKISAPVSKGGSTNYTYTAVSKKKPKVEETVKTKKKSKSYFYTVNIDKK